MASLLLIDDDEQLLRQLAQAVEQVLPAAEASVETWVPQDADMDASEAFAEKVSKDVVLVITDWDLTKRGQMGLFGPSIVEWSQARLIPVGDFSRGNAGVLEAEPNLFEFRVPTSTMAAAANFIAAVYRGFVSISSSLAAHPNYLESRSPSTVLANVLGEQTAATQFSPYGLRLGTMSSPLMGKITSTADDATPPPEEKRAILVYVLGHLLLNAILKFPGPIMSGPAIAAHVGVADSELAALSDLFDAAKYSGPFSELGPYFWHFKVGARLVELVEALPEEPNVETQGELNRVAIEHHLKRKMARHGCPRCKGNNGGFYCPLTKRAVCIRPDCSVGSNSWIPQGATLCRIEREFYDEWSPILGF